jgi:tetrahydromethanopterin S-methyltransferase subunit F
MLQPGKGSSVDKIKIYSPIQVGVGSFLGGPLAAVFVLWKNFSALDKPSAATQTLIWGLVFSVVLLVVLPYLPDKFPNTAIPIGYTAGAISVAKSYQMSKEAIRESEQYTFQSNWNVFGISIGFMVTFLVVAVVWILGLDYLGLIRL